MPLQVVLCVETAVAESALEGRRLLVLIDDVLPVDGARLEGRAAHLAQVGAFRRVHRQMIFQSVLGMAQAVADGALVGHQLSLGRFVRTAEVLKAVLAQGVGPLESLAAGVAQVRPDSLVNVLDVAGVVRPLVGLESALAANDRRPAVLGRVGPVVALVPMETVRFVRAPVALAHDAHRSIVRVTRTFRRLWLINMFLKGAHQNSDLKVPQSGWSSFGA